MKKILLFLFMTMFLFVPSVFAQTKMYGRISLTGGVNSVDNIAYAGLNDGDLCIVVTSDKALYYYRFESSSSATESSPEVITPDDQTGNGRWELVTTLANGASSNPSWTFKDSDAPGTDKDIASIGAEYIDGADGSENGDIIIYVWQNGVKTEVFRFDESDDVWETTKFIASPVGTTTTAGPTRMATTVETNTGTAVDRAVTPNGLAGSDLGTKDTCFNVVDSDTAVTTGDGVVAFTVPNSWDGMNIIDFVCSVKDKGVTGTTEIQLRRRRAGADVDVFSTKITMGDEWYASDEVINTSNDDLQTGDQLYIDIDLIHTGTAPNGLSCTLEAQKP